MMSEITPTGPNNEWSTPVTGVSNIIVCKVNEMGRWDGRRVGGYKQDECRHRSNMEYDQRAGGERMKGLRWEKEGSQISHEITRCFGNVSD